VIPPTEALRPADQAIIDIVEGGFESVGKLYDSVKIRAALAETMRLASEVNKYLDQTAPWKEIKGDKQAAGTTIFTALRVIDSLKILFAPVLPFTSEALHCYLGYEKPLFGKQIVDEREDNLGTHNVLRYLPEDASGHWVPSQLASGGHFQKPKPLFQKLDEKIVEQERARLGT
jgi:methionyl-tRNA synthetase